VAWLAGQAAPGEVSVLDGAGSEGHSALAGVGQMASGASPAIPVEPLDGQPLAVSWRPRAPVPEKPCGPVGASGGPKPRSSPMGPGGR
jgi:hypothetical protein